MRRFRLYVRLETEKSSGSAEGQEIRAKQSTRGARQFSPYAWVTVKCLVGLLSLVCPRVRVLSLSQSSNTLPMTSNARSTVDSWVSSYILSWN